MALWGSLRKSVENSLIKVPIASREVVEVISATEIIKFTSNHKTQVPFDVCDHIRNLPDGWQASTKKITTAAEYGYNFKPGQTWVDTYTKGVSVA